MNFPVEQDLRYPSLLAAAGATTKVGTLTHSFYRYPARFGEMFVREAVQNFSSEGETVLDPFCGGGTTLVEALSAGRIAIGSDLSELAITIAKAKTTPLSGRQLDVIGNWVSETTSSTKTLLAAHPDATDPRLINVPPAARHLVAAVRERVGLLPSGESQLFARCLLLKAVQWAYDGKEHLPTPSQIVERIRDAFQEMRIGMVEYSEALGRLNISKQDAKSRRLMRVGAAGDLSPRAFGLAKPSVSLVVTSPPYLGVHVLYNRWQIQGRKELKVPFFIADCADIGGPAAYTIVARGRKSNEKYFSTIEASFRAIRSMLKSKAYVVQLVSFANSETALPLYLNAMSQAGLDLCESYLHTAGDLTWRSVPGRRWYARVGAVSDSSASQEVLLVHRKGAD